MILELIKLNPWKLLLLLTFVISTTFVLKFEYKDVTERQPIHSRFTDNNTQYYVYGYNSRSFTVKELYENDGDYFDESKEVIEAVTTHMYVFEILNWVIVGLSCAAFILLHTDESGWWDFKKARDNVMIRDVRADEENGVNHYSYKGYFLCKIPTSESNYRVRQSLKDELRSFRKAPFLYKVFEGTTQMKREGYLSGLINKDEEKAT